MIKIQRSVYNYEYMFSFEGLQCFSFAVVYRWNPGLDFLVWF